MFFPIYIDERCIEILNNNAIGNFITLENKRTLNNTPFCLVICSNIKHLLVNQKEILNVVRYVSDKCDKGMYNANEIMRFIKASKKGFQVYTTSFEYMINVEICKKLTKDSISVFLMHMKVLSDYIYKNGLFFSDIQLNSTDPINYVYVMLTPYITEISKRDQEFEYITPLYSLLLQNKKNSTVLFLLLY